MHDYTADTAMSDSAMTSTNPCDPTSVPAIRRAPRTRALAARAGRRLRMALSGDAGMSTVEYAIGTLAAAAFGAVLYTVVSGGSIPDALTGIITRALNTAV